MLNTIMRIGHSGLERCSVLCLIFLCIFVVSWNLSCFDILEQVVSL